MVANRILWFMMHGLVGFVKRRILNTPLKGNVIEFDTWKVLIPQTCKDDKRSKALQLVDTLIRH